MNIYGIKVKVTIQNNRLEIFVRQYYALFLVDILDDVDLEIYIDKYGYFGKPSMLDDLSHYTTVGDDIKVDFKNKKYFFRNQEISGLLTFENNGKTVVRGYLCPRKIHHILHIFLQGFKRIDKYYNRFIVKSLIHDPIFILLEKKLSINILHATAVTNGTKTFIFTGLGGSGKSTLASLFLAKKGYKILSDNYCLVKDNLLYPFPELPRITKETANLLGIEAGDKADGIKSYLKNELSGLKKSYHIDKVFICSYAQKSSLMALTEKEKVFELLFAINNYTKEFPEYLNLAMLALMDQFNTGRQRILSLEKFTHSNKFFLLQNDKDLNSNLETIENV